MTIFRSSSAFFLVVLSAAAALASPAAHAAAAGGAESAAEGGSGETLPEDAILARVENRLIRVRDFRDRYFASDAEFRPPSDSAGRASFLDRLIDKEVLALSALEVSPPLSAEDQRILDRHTRTVLQNVFYQREVEDSIQVTEEEIREVYPQYAYAQHLRFIQFPDLETGQKARLDILAGRITWEAALKRHGLPVEDSSPDGDLGWVGRVDVRGELATQLFSLEPGDISEVLHDADGYRLFQALDRRPASQPPYSTARRWIRDELRGARSSPRVARMYERARARAQASYDTTNIRWAVSKFLEAPLPSPSSATMVVDLSSKLPRIEPADTARVLARTPTRRFTLGQFVDRYSQIPPLNRRRIASFGYFLFLLNGMFLEPEIVEFARSSGLDRDPLAVKQIQERREELMVEHVYRDSILRYVRAAPEDREKFFAENEHKFLSYSKVVYARLVCPNEGAADSMIARLKAGERARDIIQSDFQGNHDLGSIEEAREDQNLRFRQILFEELEVGDATKLGPDSKGQFLVLQLLSYEPPRQLAYADVEAIVVESLENMQAEKLLDEFLVRRRPNYRIEAHPELLNRVKMVDPVLD